MDEKTCAHCEKKVETQQIYFKKAEDTFFERCVECREPVSDKDATIKQLMLEIEASERRTNLVIGAGITIFLIISLIREFL